MVNEEHYRKLERMYHSAPINQIYRPKLEIGDGLATVTMEVRSEFFHALKALHGSVYFKMLDDAAFFAANSRIDGFFALTTDFNIHFLRPVTAGVLVAEGKLVSASSTLFVVEARLLNNQNLVAIGTGTFYKSHHQLKAEHGYL